MELKKQEIQESQTMQTEQVIQTGQLGTGDAAEDKHHCWQGLSSSTLKIIALVTMLIDHVAAAILVRFFLAGQYRQYMPVYDVMRSIGRIAFPIYCYMLVEGLKYTRNQWKYLARLGVFALVSEIPFDLAFQSRILETGYQNVYFTLFFGLLAMIMVQELGNRIPVWFEKKGPLISNALLSLMIISITISGMGLAWLFRTDYGWMGIVCILIFYYNRRNKWMQLAMGYLAFGFLLGEWVALPAFVLIALYKGKKGFSCKALFYGFYPLHLLLLYIACVLLHIAQYSAL